ncbi:DUF2145 domain-containing protein [Aliiglaciecola sp. LCG003]|uniref:DUF2145 domain-containing protein n=1 Tax=Aliiglaciecola sp. LCG003 TaxID=3053655 RepID=UPI0025739A65|nr:DUF2145 domain-containing protein [Aliiglaciecola sp. LCG003]WJG10814.1 DUF2145 domain-containing protein [Aliiglaciecola sp. LCG003]
MHLRHVLLIFLLVVPSAWAGSQSQAEALHEPEKIIKFAKDVEKYAASKGARAFIIARVGRPEKDLPKGIKFTHTALAIYSNIELTNGEVLQGYAIHNLYQLNGQADKSELVVDYPIDFFWGAQELTAGVLIPSIELQQKLIELIASGNDKLLHNNNYSVIANPFNNQFQNCTEYTLDLINAAIYQTLDMEQLKVNAQAHFKPQKLSTSRFKLMFGSMLMDDVTTKDHKGKVYTATFSSLGRYLQSNQLSDDFVTFQANGEVTAL